MVLDTSLKSQESNRGRWVRSAKSTSVLCDPLRQPKFLLFQVSLKPTSFNSNCVTAKNDSADADKSECVTKRQNKISPWPSRIGFQKIDAYLASHPTQFRKKSLFLSFDDDLNELVLTLMGSNFMTLRIYFGGTETLDPTIKIFEGYECWLGLGTVVEQALGCFEGR